MLLPQESVALIPPPPAPTLKLVNSVPLHMSPALSSCFPCARAQSEFLCSPLLRAACLGLLQNVVGLGSNSQMLWGSLSLALVLRAWKPSVELGPLVPQRRGAL